MLEVTILLVEFLSRNLLLAKEAASPRLNLLMGQYKDPCL
jgi:hypothetical protein